MESGSVKIHLLGRDGFPQLGGERFGALEIKVSNDDGRARSAQRTDGLLTDTACATGDQSAPAVESKRGIRGHELLLHERNWALKTPGYEKRASHPQCSRQTAARKRRNAAGLGIREEEGLAIAIRDSSPRQIVGGKFELNTVSREDADAVFPQLAGNLRKYFMLVVQLDAENAAGMFFNDGAGNFNSFFLRHSPPSR